MFNFLEGSRRQLSVHTQKQNEQRGSHPKPYIHAPSMVGFLILQSSHLARALLSLRRSKNCFYACICCIITEDENDKNSKVAKLIVSIITTVDTNIRIETRRTAIMSEITSIVTIVT